jgi:hypothetical protein
MRLVYLRSDLQVNSSGIVENGSDDGLKIGFLGRQERIRAIEFNMLVATVDDRL